MAINMDLIVFFILFLFFVINFHRYHCFTTLLLICQEKKAALQFWFNVLNFYLTFIDFCNFFYKIG